MPNKIRGESEFLAGTERYVMRLTLGALAEIENGLGVSSLSEIAGKLKSLGTMDLAMVAAALLRGAGHDIAPAEVLKLDTGLGTLIGAITDAFDAVGLKREGSSPAQPGRGTAQSAVEGAHASPLAGTASSNSPSA
ncbi:MAG: gene transfer agent family protein [Alphaproteobacteria bacterium]|nr:gene transfer agent family protein [Alphaproteobacteria bacterium]